MSACDVSLPGQTENPMPAKKRDALNGSGLMEAYDGRV